MEKPVEWAALLQNNTKIATELGETSAHLKLLPVFSKLLISDFCFFRKKSTETIRKVEIRNLLSYIYE
jgi:hypothetical protein